MSVEREVVRGPVEIRARRVHAGRLPRPSRGSRAGEAAGVSEEVEELRSARLFPNARPGVAMMREEARIDVVVEIDPEAQVALPHREPALRPRETSVLLPAAAHFQMHPGGGNGER